MFRGSAGFFLIPQKRADGVHADLADKAFEIADQVRALVIGQSEGEAFREPAFQTGMNLFPQSVVAWILRQSKQLMALFQSDGFDRPRSRIQKVLHRGHRAGVFGVENPGIVVIKILDVAVD